MRRPITTLVVALGLLGAPTSALAECAWVLWQEHRISASGGLSSTWEIGEALQTRDACASRAALATKTRAEYMKTSNASAPRPDPDQKVEVVGDTVQVTLARAGQFWVYRHVCLPDTLDPRGPTGR